MYKLRIIFLVLMLIGFACQAQNKIDKQGRRQGHWIKTDTDGSRLFEGNFEDGKEVGVFNYYYPDGTLKIRNTFTVPGRYCKHEAYDKKGRLIATGYYNQHNRDSIWNFYNTEGKLVKTAGYRMGVKQGLHIVFNSNGDTAEVASWNDNHRHGRWWKRLGEKAYITGYYEKGLMQGHLKEYDNNGKLLRDCLYKDGVKDGRSRYYENGTLTIDETWSQGSLADRKILIRCDGDKWQSVFGIAYLLPKGSNGTLIYLNDGSKLICKENIEVINERLGHEMFVLIDRKQRVTANMSAIMGITKDSDGRDIIDLQPTPPFTIFPDDECLKMVRSLNRIDQLDERE